MDDAFASVITMDKLRILVIDDNSGISRFVQVILEKTSRYTVRTENLPRHALDATREFKPHIILLDVDMPGTDGGQVARQIRADAALKHTPIVFFTSLISKEDTGAAFFIRGGERYL